MSKNIMVKEFEYFKELVNKSFLQITAPNVLKEQLQSIEFSLCGSR